LGQELALVHFFTTRRLLPTVGLGRLHAHCLRSRRSRVSPREGIQFARRGQVAEQGADGEERRHLESRVAEHRVPPITRSGHHPRDDEHVLSGDLVCLLLLSAPSRRSKERYSSNANTRFQSFFMLMTVHPRFFASSYSAWVKMPTRVSG